jgi:hypothetical protein
LKIKQGSFFHGLRAASSLKTRKITRIWRQPSVLRADPKNGIGQE